MKKSLTYNIRLKLLAFLFAFLLWLFVVNVEDPVVEQIYRDVSVTVSNEEVLTQAEVRKTFQIVDDTQTVDVTVRAKRSIINKIDKEDILAVADMRELYLDSMIPIKVSIPEHDGDYESAISNPRNLQVKIEDNASKTIPITPTTTGAVRDGYMLGEIKANPEKVTLNGPESVIDSITKVVAEVNVTGLSQNESLESSIILYNADNQIVDQSLLGNNLGNIGASVDVTVLRIKSVALNVDISQIQAAAGYSIANVEYEPQKIEIAGEKEVLDQITKIDIPSSAFENQTISKKTEVTVDVKPYLPENTRLADENANSVLVTISIEKDGTKSFNLPVGSIVVKNLNEDMKLTFVSQEDLEVHVRGSEESLAKLSIDKEASIDLKNLKRRGEYSVPVEINLPYGCFLDQDVKVVIKLEEK